MFSTGSPEPDLIVFAWHHRPPEKPSRIASDGKTDRRNAGYGAQKASTAETAMNANAEGVARVMSHLKSLTEQDGLLRRTEDAGCGRVMAGADSQGQNELL